GEIRDEGATGIGARPKAGLTGFAVSNLRIPGLMQPWELPEAPKRTLNTSLAPEQPSPPPLSQRERGDSCGFADSSARGEMECGADALKYWIGKPDRIASALDIMIEGP